MSTSERIQERAELLRKGNSAPVARLTGMIIEEIGDGTSCVRLPFSQDLMQAHGRMHGGLYGLLADTAGYFAAASLQSVDGVTLEYKVNLLEGVVGESLVAHGRVIRAGGTVSHCEIDITSETGTWVAKALATYRFFKEKRA